LNKYKEDFPILNTTSNGHRLVYLDSAATAQKPNAVIDAVAAYYREANANPHRGNYDLSIRATEIYEQSREVIKNFIGAEKSEEIIFTKNTTESFNLLAYSYGMNYIGEGDEIVISIAEHHSNLVPWQQVAKAKGAILKYLYLNSDGVIDDAEIESKITEKTKLVSVTHVSNVLGTISPVDKIVRKAHSVGALVALDCAQSIPHFKVDVKELGVDFAAFSGHKMMAPMGVGVLYGRAELLDKMPPFLTGGDMIEYVYEQSATFAPLPQKFEAGTQNVGGALGIAEAARYIEKIGYSNIAKVESEIVQYAVKRLAELPYLTIYGDQNGGNRCGVISFNIQDAHPHDVASILDAGGIGIRAGHHCAQPLMRYLDVNATCRASFYFYNTLEDVDILVDNLKTVRKWLGYGS
jgi:cysteine desulfurase/selenocysteine lyase